LLSSIQPPHNLAQAVLPTDAASCASAPSRGKRSLSSCPNLLLSSLSSLSLFYHAAGGNILLHHSTADSQDMLLFRQFSATVAATLNAWLGHILPRKQQRACHYHHQQPHHLDDPNQRFHGRKSSFDRQHHHYRITQYTIIKWPEERESLLEASPREERLAPTAARNNKATLKKLVFR